MKLFLGRAQVHPTLDRCGVEVSRVVLQYFLNGLARTFQLLGVPEEGGCAQQVLVTGHLLAFVLLEDEGVDALLVNVAAPFVEVNQGQSGCILTLTTILDF